MNDEGGHVFIRDEVVQKANKRDGAPPDYYQVYEEESFAGPFKYPLVSDWVTKSLGAPRPLERQVLSLGLAAVRWQLVFGYLALRFDSWPLFLVGAAGNLFKLRGVYRLVQEDFMSLLGGLRWAPTFMAPTVGGDE